MVDKIFLKIKKLLPVSTGIKLPRKVAIISITSRESRKLNFIYREKDRPTNVLSFRYNGDYGEILLCPDVIRKEAKKAGNMYKYQFAWMILHGTIHLTGIHHEKSKAVEDKVRKLEEGILYKLFGSLKFEIRNPKF